MIESLSASVSPRAAGRPAMWWLFFGALGVFAFTRLFDLEGFPIYFFSDEAVHTVLFRMLQSHHWRGFVEPREFLPAYFLNGRTFNLSLSVYLQGLASMIGGQSVATVRATSALASLSGAVALAISLRRYSPVREWWSVVAFLTVLPCWFLHSRTGFETVLMVSGYCWFFYFYLRYRVDSPRWIFAAMLAGAWVFYSYAPGQGIMLITGVLLLVCDFRYHWKHAPWVAGALAFGLLLAFPYLRFRFLHREMLAEHLRILNSYWTAEISTGEKLKTFFMNYLAGFSPRYWFVPGAEQYIRHAVPYYAHLPALLLPLVLLGGWLVWRSWRNPFSRLVLIAIVAMPFSSAMVSPGITRMLTVVVPFSLCAAMGFDQLLSWVPSYSLRAVTRWAAFVLLAVDGGLLLELSLLAGPSYQSNYGLYGMQWGAQKLFRDLIPRYLKSDPLANVVIMHTTFNGADVFPQFFGWMDDRRISYGAVDDLRLGFVLPEPADLILFAASDVTTLGTFPNVERFVVREKIPFPDGRDGFFLGHVLFKPGFAEKIRSDPHRAVRPAMSRLGSDGVIFSAAVQGNAAGSAADLFTPDGSGLVSRRGEPINLTIYFNHPVLPGGVRVSANAPTIPRSGISIWGKRGDKTVTQALGVLGAPTAELIFSRETIDEIRIELRAVPDHQVKLERVELTFADSELPRAR